MKIIQTVGVFSVRHWVDDRGIKLWAVYKGEELASGPFTCACKILPKCQLREQDRVRGWDIGVWMVDDPIDTYHLLT